MKKSGKLFFTIAYLAMAIPMFCLPKEGFFIASFGVEYKYLLGIGIIALALLHFLISADLRSAIRCGQDSLVMARPYLWTLAYSLVFWVVTLAGFRVMTKGTFYIVYQLIAIFAAAGTVYMFGSRAVYLQVLAMTATLAILAVQQVGQVGLGEFLRQYVYGFTTFSSNAGDAMRTFETKGYCYVVGFYLVYFLMTAREKRANIFWAAVSLLMFFLGMKRSVVLGVLVALVFGLVISRARKPEKWVKPVALISIGLVLGYIVWVYNGLFDWLEAIGITTSGRNWLYGRIRDFYHMSPVYFGKGAGFVATAFSNGVFDLSEYGVRIGEIHNEYLRQYIEYGFWGFIIWVWLYTANRVKYFFHTASDAPERRHGVIAFALVMVNCVMFLTENSLYYFYTTMALSTMIMGYRHETFAERTKLPGEET